jgi:RNA polymerase sigma-70 factor, ECF subfamily
VEGALHEKSFEELFRAEYPWLVHILRSMLGETARAEEVAQEAFVGLYARWPKISRYEEPRLWLRRIAIRIAGRVQRRDTERFSGSEPIGQDPFRDLDLERAIRMLPGAQRAAVILHYYEDRPVAEVAFILGCAESTARVHLHRARTRLGQILGEEVADVSR